MRVTLRRVLHFRAPGSALTTLALVVRALDESAERAAERIRSGALAELEPDKPKLLLTRTEQVVAPGSLLQLDVRAARSEPPPAQAFEALAPALPWPAGRCDGFSFETLEERSGVARLRLTLAGASLGAVRAWLAAAGSAVLGDAVHGGILVAGGLRLAPASAVQSEPAASAAAWPDEAVFPPAAPAAEGKLRISPGTARALQRGHPWLIADDETETGERFAPGTLVVLTSSDGQTHGLARSEGARDLAAVLWARG